MTQIVHFLGQVWPAAAVTIAIEYEPTIKWVEPTLDFEPSFIVRLRESKVDVECQLDAFRLDRYILLYNRAFDLARAAVDLVAFSTGFSLSVTFNEFVHPDGKKDPILFSNPKLGTLCTAFQLGTSGNKGFDDVYKIVIGDFRLFMALRDLIDANTLPHIGVINCGRVLDSIRRMISPTEKETARGWAAMQAALNISRPYQQWVSDLSTNPRHGDRSFISGSDSSEAITRTWSVMNRFLEYRKRGNAPLTAPEFPVLNP